MTLLKLPRSRLLLAVVPLTLPASAFTQHSQEEIRVIATPQDHTIAEMAQSVTVLGDETLRRIQSTNLGETLAGELGVSASAFSAAASRPIIRGLAGARIKMMEDGIDSLDVSSVSVDHAVGIDPLVAEQIEIFRGPTTLLYGSGAVGGVVNTVTRRIPEMPPEAGLEGAFEIRGDTVADDRTGAFRFDGGNDSFAWHVDGLRRDAGNYEIPGFAELGHDDDHEAEEEGHEEEQFGLLENSSFDVSNLAVGGTWFGENSFFGVSVGGYKSNYGVPGHHHEEESEGENENGEEEEEIVRIDLDQTRIDLKGGWVSSGGFIEAVNYRLGINDYEHQELEGAEVGTLFSNDAFEGRVEFLHRPLSMSDGAFGIQFGEREFSAIGDEAFIPPVDTSTIGIFGLEHFDLENWSLSLGGRLESQEHSPSIAAADFSGTAASLSFAAIRRLGEDYALALHIASAERLPVAEELYANGPHLASRTFEFGDPTIDKETSRHIDIGLRKTSGTLTWSLTAFYTSFDDFIFLRDTGIEDAESELPIFAYNQQDAHVSGFEAELFTPLANFGTGEIDLRLYADYVRGELDSNENLPRLPPLRIGARVQYHHDEIVAGIEAARYTKQDDIAQFEEPTPGYTMVNADLNWVLPSSTSELETNLFFKGTNLLDEDARRHTSLVKDIAPLQGRNFQFGFRALF
ncbi:MAG: TonB-dependent receptor [Gammaproteobacteria bacterium]